MCWNADISINTFIFSSFALVFIYISNTYTRYKVEGFTTLFVYFYFFLFVSIQLFEYFIWKNLNNKRMNTFFSKVGFFIIFLQTLLVNFLAEPIYQSYLFIYFFIFFVSLITYKHLYNPFDFRTVVAPSGHLSWEWLRFTGYEKIFFLVGLSFYLIPWILSKNVQYLNIYLLIITFIVTYMLLKKDNTYGSMWCWVFNLMMIFYVIQILIVLPFCEYHGLC
jgi:hypothetical protein